MATLYSSVIKLQALSNGQLTRDPGRWANAAFYTIMEQIESSLAEGLHHWNGPKPFTLSSLRGMPHGKGPAVEVHTGWECWLRVTTLGDRIFNRFIQRCLLGRTRPYFQTGPILFLVSEVLTTAGSHPWAGCCEASSLLSQAGAADRLTLNFATPTTFNLETLTGSSSCFALFPNPRLVFGSLAAKWRNFVSADFDVADVERLASEAQVIDYRLETQTLQWKGRVQKGFTGECTFDIHTLASDEKRLLAALADFAFYSGAGGKTTRGMGQCRRSDNY